MGNGRFFMPYMIKSWHINKVYRILWSKGNVMLNAVKHPRSVEILRFAQNDKTSANPKEPLIFISIQKHREEVDAL